MASVLTLTGGERGLVWKVTKDREEKEEEEDEDESVRSTTTARFLTEVSGGQEDGENAAAEAVVAQITLFKATRTGGQDRDSMVVATTSNGIFIIVKVAKCSSRTDADEWWRDE
jgi:hypothetical protein